MMNRLLLFLCGAIITVVAFTCSEPNTPPPPPPIDSTSHNFTWHTDTLGAWLSRVNDVFCLSETEAYAVGLFYVLDSTGKVIDSLTANLAHWDGLKWKLERVNPRLNGMQTFAELITVYAFSSNDVWVNYRHWDGKVWTPYNLNSIALGGTKKMWGLRSNEIYSSGENGSILIWNGQNFQEIGFSTTAHNTDVWGDKDLVYIAVSDYNQESGYRGYLVRIINGKVIDKQLFESGELIAVWGMSGTWYAGGCNGNQIFKKESNTWISIPFPSNQCITSIRGTALNNFFVAIESRGVYHFNGMTFKEILPVDNQASIFANVSCAGKAILVTSNKGTNAFIYRGYRIE